MTKAKATNAADLAPRIRAAIKRITSGSAAMRIPVDDTDPDIVLDDCLGFVEAAAQRAAARPIEEYHEDFGDVLWWRFPIVEAPYVGSPLDTNWPGDTPGLELTHWTRIDVPEAP